MTLVRTILNIASLALLALVGWLLVRSVLGFLNPESLYEPNPVIAPTTIAVQPGQARRYDFTTDPFSKTEIVQIEEKEELTSDAPETSLDLTLKGVATDGAASIALQSGTEKNFRIEDEIMNGVTLDDIGKDFVTLNVNGEIQKLSLERSQNAQNGDAVIKTAPKADVTKTSTNALQNNSNRPVKLASASSSSLNAQNLLNQVNISPDYGVENGKKVQRGFKINPKSGVDLSPYGLKSGDVLTRIGSLQLNTERLDFQALQNLISQGAAQDVEVLRNGNPVTIRIGQ